MSAPMKTLLTEIEAFCAAHNIKTSRFSQLAMNDKAFVIKLRAGRRTWPETEAKVRDFMREYAANTEQAA